SRDSHVPPAREPVTPLERMSAIAEANGPPLREKVLASRNESAAHRDARRAVLAREIHRLSPSLSSEKQNFMRDLSDRNDAEFRRLRAAFMLGQFSEDEYMDQLKTLVHRGLDEAKAFLTREEYAVLEGSPDHDPFEPHGRAAPRGYLTPGQAAAKENPDNITFDPRAEPERARERGLPVGEKEETP
ncbi:MAG TPA: hypothetical protein VMK12_17135, partial [Anaeromyxobacteraceae bacterium]|nr:hypothetical protein [Anaeromyxobacteraceae bacterium]